MATEVSIHVFGTEFFARKIRKMEYRAMDMTPVMRHIGNKVQSIIEEQFATQGVRGGKKWNPLEFDTISRRGSAEPILIHTGEMLAEVLDDHNFDAHPEGLDVKIPEGVRVKAESAQFGFNVSNKQGQTGRYVEPRPILHITDFDRKVFNRDITDYLVNGRLG